ncbi:hypothetical protein CBR_g36320 [Chara braunii]|uniref:Uncharacterized protein n=1 Tax=Chara braunii TaxID=69332 RepID=A0A388LKF7_CHABU|nr:hypothetical protein CBR_g36320 [Chara braunii]|eukprot:GBG82789.1 hypothetical protein CBR_g36320 [Chara braunii]
MMNIVQYTENGYADDVPDAEDDVDSGPPDDADAIISNPDADAAAAGDDDGCGGSDCDGNDEGDDDVRGEHGCGRGCDGNNDGDDDDDDDDGHDDTRGEGGITIVGSTSGSGDGSGNDLMGDGRREGCDSAHGSDTTDNVTEGDDCLGIIGNEENDVNADPPGFSIDPISSWANVDSGGSGGGHSTDSGKDDRTDPDSAPKPSPTVTGFLDIDVTLISCPLDPNCTAPPEVWRGWEVCCDDSSEGVTVGDGNGEIVGETTDDVTIDDDRVSTIGNGENDVNADPPGFNIDAISSWANDDSGSDGGHAVRPTFDFFHAPPGDAEGTDTGKDDRTDLDSAPKPSSNVSGFLDIDATLISCPIDPSCAAPPEVWRGWEVCCNDSSEGVTIGDDNDEIVGETADDVTMDDDRVGIIGNGENDENADPPGFNIDAISSWANDDSGRDVGHTVRPTFDFFHVPPGDAAGTDSGKDDRTDPDSAPKPSSTVTGFLDIDVTLISCPTDPSCAAPTEVWRGWEVCCNDSSEGVTVGDDNVEIVDETIGDVTVDDDRLGTISNGENDENADPPGFNIDAISSWANDDSGSDGGHTVRPTFDFFHVPPGDAEGTDSGMDDRTDLDSAPKPSSTVTGFLDIDVTLISCPIDPGCAATPEVWRGREVCCNDSSEDITVGDDNGEIVDETTDDVTIDGDRVGTIGNSENDVNADPPGFNIDAISSWANADSGSTDSGKDDCTDPDSAAKLSPTVTGFLNIDVTLISCPIDPGCAATPEVRRGWEVCCNDVSDDVGETMGETNDDNGIIMLANTSSDRCASANGGDPDWISVKAPLGDKNDGNGSKYGDSGDTVCGCRLSSPVWVCSSLSPDDPGSTPSPQLLREASEEGCDDSTAGDGDENGRTTIVVHADDEGTEDVDDFAMLDNSCGAFPNSCADSSADCGKNATASGGTDGTDNGLGCCPTLTPPAAGFPNTGVCGVPIGNSSDDDGKEGDDISTAGRSSAESGDGIPEADGSAVSGKDLWMFGDEDSCEDTIHWAGADNEQGASVTPSAVERPPADMGKAPSNNMDDEPEASVSGIKIGSDTDDSKSTAELPPLGCSAASLLPHELAKECDETTADSLLRGIGREHGGYTTDAEVEADIEPG